MYRRNIIPELAEALSDTPVVFLRGARQVGKSTLAKELLGDIFPAKYVTLDNATLLAAASADPSGFLTGQPRPLIIDEVQRVPDLLVAIKEEIDKKRQPGQFLITGSANLLTLPVVSDSLAGRMEVLTLWPLARAELQGHKTDFIKSLFQDEIFQDLINSGNFSPQEVVFGGYPEAISRKTAKRRTAWFESYIISIIERDVRDMTRITETESMIRLLRYLATRTATLLNQSELSRSIQIPVATLRRYLDLLQKVFLVHFLPAWSTNLGKRLVKTPKIYVVDSGLASHLIGMDEEGFTLTPEPAGQLVETYAINELQKHLTWSEIKARPYHFRSHSGLEVDLVLERPSGEVACIEIKHARQVTSKHFRGLKELKGVLGDRFKTGVVLYSGQEVVPFGKNLFAVPLSSL